LRKTYPLYASYKPFIFLAICPTCSGPAARCSIPIYAYLTCL